MTAYQVLGRTVETPVQVRTASAFMAAFTVPSARAQSVIDYSGLRVHEYRKGRAICMLVFVDYVDGDLGRYEEFGVTFLVRDHRTSRGSGAFIHRLPVNGDFTLAAGRGIWGFPKTLASFDTDHTTATKHGTLSAGGQIAVRLDVKRGVPLPGSGRKITSVAYSHLDGITRHTPWEMTPFGTRSRLGGAALTLGNHPIADELRELGLPRHALFTTSVRNIAMTFGDAAAV